MNIKQLNQLIRDIVSELADLETQAIESWDLHPVDIPLTFRLKVVGNVFNRYNINPTRKMMMDGVDMYYSETILNSIYGGTK